jgi:competence protein ComEA
MIARFRLDRRALLIIALCAATGLVGVGFALKGRINPAQGSLVRAPETPERVIVVEPTQQPTVEALVVVHVSGAVQRPAVYELQDGLRVRDAIAAAGGAADGADPNALNLAAKLKDGQHVVVPTLVVDPPSGSTVAAAPAEKKLLNLNTASAAELETLPGVGEVIAKRIVTYRAEAGSFASVDELRTEKLVNEATFAKLRDLVVAE